MRGEPSPRTGGHDVPEPRELLLLVVIALIPIAQDLTIWSVPTGAVGNYHLRVGISALHLPLTALVILSALHFVRTPRLPVGPYAATIAAAAAWLIVSFLVAPGWRGVDVLFHLSAAWAIWDTVQMGTSASHRRLLVALCTLAAVEGAFAVTQRFIGDNVGIDLLEAPGTFYRYGSTVAVRGSLVHQYHFVILTLICTTAVLVLLQWGVSRHARHLLVAELALLGFVVPMTFSRTSVLAVVPMVAMLALRFRKRLGIPTMVWIAGLSVGALTSIEGVSGRAVSSVSSNGSSFDSGRTERYREAWDLIRAHPVTGTGPGNYVIELQKDLGLVGDPSVKVLPSHNIITHYAAEAGVIGGVLTFAVLIALGVWSIRGGALRVLVAVALPPFLLLDLFPYTWQLGTVLTGLWLAIAGVAGTASATPRGADPPDVAEHQRITRRRTDR